MQGLVEHAFSLRDGFSPQMPNLVSPRDLASGDGFSSPCSSLEAAAKRSRASREVFEGSRVEPLRDFFSFATIMAELARWCRAQRLSETMTNAVIKAFVDLDSLRSCANDPGMVDEGLKEQGLTLALRMKVVATVSALTRICFLVFTTRCFVRLRRLQPLVLLPLRVLAYLRLVPPIKTLVEARVL